MTTMIETVAEHIGDGVFCRYPNPTGRSVGGSRGPAELAANVAGVRPYASEPWWAEAAEHAAAMSRVVTELVQLGRREIAYEVALAGDTWVIVTAAEPSYDRVLGRCLDATVTRLVDARGGLTSRRQQANGETFPADRFLSEREADGGPVDPVKARGRQPWPGERAAAGVGP